jgi:hypothetical protein
VCPKTLNIKTYIHIYKCSGCKITPSLGYVTVGGEGKMERTRESKMAKSLSTYTTTENIFSSFNFDTVSGILIQ